MQYAPAPLPEQLRLGYRSAGLQTDITMPDLMRRNVYEFGTAPAVVDGERTFTWSEFLEGAFRFAGFLETRGIGPGDVVMWQLPNWWEALVVACGVWAAGAVSAPVVPTYRERELRHVVETVRPRCVVVAERFRNTDHVELMEEVLVAEPIRVVVRGARPGWTSWEQAVRSAPASAPPVDPGAPSMVGFTSGTTSGAKAVVMSTQALLAVPLRHVRAVPYTWKDRGYMPAPVSHVTGLMMALLIPLVSGCSVVLAERWDAGQAVEDIRRQGVTYTAGAQVFLQELVAATEAAGLDALPLSCGFNGGGSTIPVDLARRAEALQMNPRRAYGMTECPTVSASSTFDPPQVRLLTDGRILPGCEVRVQPDGELVVRGPQRALGYVEPSDTAEAFDSEGWFRTGDLGQVDREGCLTVTGRTKDIINRGGEKLSAREIEEAIARHPQVRDVAVVAAPHPRLGEEPAAFVVMSNGSGFDEDQLARFVRAEGMAAYKVPRRWVCVDDLPRTPSGKVKKYELTDRFGRGAAH